MEGWIKLHRKILDSKFGCNLEMSGLFDRLLLMANFKEGFTVDGTKILPGQFMTSQELLAKKFSIERNKMRRMLNKLESAQQIAQQTSAKNTIITIVNWHLYQGDEQVSEHQMNISRTSSEHQVNTNKNANNANNGKKNTGRKKILPNGQTQDDQNPTLFEVEPLQLPEETSPDDLATKILTAFNAICFKACQPTAFNLGKINARIKEGYSYEEFVKVIKFKNAQWKDDSKMREYITPATFFCGKFDGYLQSANAADAPMSDDEADRIIAAYFPGA